MSMSPSFACETPLWDETVPGGCHWSARLRRGTVLRLTALQACANASVLLFNAEDTLERYNMPDTLKSQHTAFLTAGHACHSDMGRVLCGIVADSVGWHDTWCGVSDAELIRQRHGESHFQTDRNAMKRNGRDGLLIELAKHGLGVRDLVPCINFFSKVLADADGVLRHVPGHCQAGAHVDLRIEMDTLVVLSTAPHPLDTRPLYQPADVRLSAHLAEPLRDDDRCRTSCEQNTRAYLNTARYLGLAAR